MRLLLTDGTPNAACERRCVAGEGNVARSAHSAVYHHDRKRLSVRALHLCIWKDFQKQRHLTTTNGRFLLPQLRLPAWAFANSRHFRCTL